MKKFTPYFLIICALFFFQLTQGQNNPPLFSSTPVTEVDNIDTYVYNITTIGYNGRATVLTASSLPDWLSLTPNVEVTTLAGSGAAGFANGTGGSAQFENPWGLDVDASGNVYVADYINKKIRKITPSGVVTTFAGSIYGDTDGIGTLAKFKGPLDIDVDASGNLYVTDRVGNRIRKISSTGEVTTLAGTGQYGSADGPGAEAGFNSPWGIAVDGTGNVYVADATNHKIRKITPAGFVTTLAGGATAGFADGVGNSALFNYPTGITVDASGNVYVTDSQNHAIRKITPAGVVTTVAGNGSNGFVDGPVGTAMFTLPRAIDIDASGTLYIADMGNQKIRMISTSGWVSTVAGSNYGFVNGPVTTAKFANPQGIAIDAAGLIYVGDWSNHAIRKLTLDGSGTLTGDPIDQVGTHNVVINASDGDGGSTNQNFAITVTVVPPPTVITQNITVSLDASGNATITTADVDNGSNDVSGTVYMSIDRSVFSCEDIGVHVVTLTATNPRGLTASETAQVTVEDVIAPAFLGCPDDIILDVESGESGVVINFETPTATENCPERVIVYNYSGSQETFVVPAGVSSIDITVAGASGGKQFQNNQLPFGTPGLGGLVTATITVVPGQVFNINVGGEGGVASIGSPAVGGYNGGGNGGSFNSTAPRQGGGGGGASDIRISGASLDDRIIVAGGGGGVGYLSGGSGGGEIGGEGPYYTGTTPATGGTQSQGGDGGTYSGSAAISGSFGVGGDGANGLRTRGLVGGGGGGGGWYGGGGGAYGDGGGGSSYMNPNATNVSSLQGVQSGNGYIIITYIPDLVVQTEGLPSGSEFPIGTTVVSFSATDVAGNTSTCSFNVTVNDIKTPRILISNSSSSLQNLLTADKNLNKNIEKAQRDISEAFDMIYWKDDSHLDTKEGKKVFDLIRNAVHELEKAQENKNAGQEYIDQVQVELDRLVSVLAQIVNIVLAESQEECADEKCARKIEDAITEMDQALGWKTLTQN